MPSLLWPFYTEVTAETVNAWEIRAWRHGSRRARSRAPRVFHSPRWGNGRRGYKEIKRNDLRVRQ